MVLPVRQSPLSSQKNDLYAEKRKKVWWCKSNLAVLGLCMISFVAGSLWTTLGSMSALQIEALVQQRLNEERQKLFGTHTKEKTTASTDDAVVRVRKALATQNVEESRRDPPHQPCESNGPRFPNSMRRFARGMARVNRANFTQTLDLGVPIDHPLHQEGINDVLFLYKSDDAVPKNRFFRSHVTSNGEIPILNAETALENCHTLHVILTQHDSPDKQCMAIVPQYPSMHIQWYMRVPPAITFAERERTRVDSNLPLRLVGRGLRQDGYNEHRPSTKETTQQHWRNLKNYFMSVDRVMMELKVLANRVARNNTIVVMVCNHGQSEILMNFVCSAKARNLDIGHVLLFATDLETKQLAESMGMTVFYDETLFSDVPTKAAVGYGDRIFAAMMMSKVYCVQLISMLGYDLLFQDVDLIWYRDPISFFQEEQNEEFDVYFQDDGARNLRYQPYSANSGFYFVKSNPRSIHFFNSFLLQGDMILTSRSHQETMIQIMSEHQSLFGLRVKVLGKERHEFPGGFHYHMDKAFMKKMIKGETNQYVFHMSWTENKDNKLLFLKQMNEWYVKDQCVGANNSDMITNNADDLQNECCSPKPLFSCHYSDKPSKYPCNDKPPIDKGAKPFWGQNELVQRKMAN